MEIGKAREIEQSINGIFNGSQGVNEEGYPYRRIGIHAQAAQYPDNYQAQRDYLIGLAHSYEDIRDIADEEIKRLRAGAGEDNMAGGTRRKKRRNMKKKHVRKTRKV